MNSMDSSGFKSHTDPGYVFKSEDFDEKSPTGKSGIVAMNATYGRNSFKYGQVNLMKDPVRKFIRDVTGLRPSDLDEMNDSDLSAKLDAIRQRTFTSLEKSRARAIEARFSLKALSSFSHVDFNEMTDADLDKIIEDKELVKTFLTGRSDSFYNQLNEKVIKKLLEETLVGFYPGFYQKLNPAVLEKLPKSIFEKHDPGFYNKLDSSVLRYIPSSAFIGRTTEFYNALDEKFYEKIPKEEMVSWNEDFLSKLTNPEIFNVLLKFKESYNWQINDFYFALEGRKAEFYDSLCSQLLKKIPEKQLERWDKDFFKSISNPFIFNLYSQKIAVDSAKQEMLKSVLGGREASFYAELCEELLEYVPEDTWKKGDKNFYEQLVSTTFLTKLSHENLMKLPRVAFEVITSRHHDTYQSIRRKYLELIDGTPQNRQI